MYLARLLTSTDLLFLITDRLYIATMAALPLDYSSDEGDGAMPADVFGLASHSPEKKQRAEDEVPAGIKTSNAKATAAPDVLSEASSRCTLAIHMS